MAGAFVAHGWLPAVLPATARRFRVKDAALSYTLNAAGGELVRDGADVEIGALDDLPIDAPTVIVPLNAHISDSRARVRQVVRRILSSADVHRRAAHVRRALEKRGYRYVTAISWDRDQAIRVGGAPASTDRSVAERFPRRVLVVAHRTPPAPTILEQALSAAGQQVGMGLGVVKPIVASGTLVVLTDGHVLRVAMGPATRLIETQANVLQALAATDPGPALGSLVPAFAAGARAGLAYWSLETRLHGRHPSAVSTPLADACMDFVVALYRAQPCQRAALDVAARQAEFLTAFVQPSVAAAIQDAAAEVDEQVGGLRHGFWHGDLWMRNLLVQDDQLVGVIDWAQGGPNGLPLLDLMNLDMVGALDPGVYEWGPAITSYLLPRASAGPSPAMREYLRRTGLAITSRQLRVLVTAYWLERVHHQLAAYVDRARDPRWLRRNIEDVVRVLARPSLARQGANARRQRAAS